MTSSITFDHVSKSFSIRTGNDPGAAREVTALDGIDLEVAAGEFSVLVGPSGCGKSTLLDLLAGLSAPSSGTIRLDGVPIGGPGLDRGVVFQQYALLPWRSARGNVEFGLEAAGLSRRERRARAEHYLDLVGLAGFADRHPHELSGGMKQRVAIARSLAVDPDVLLMDEPFAALDAQTRETLQDELLRIWARTGKTIVFITHAIDEAVFLGRQVTVLTSRPARVKQIIPIELGARDEADDVRSSPEFARHRHQVWAALRDEVQRADRQARGHSTKGAPTERDPAALRPAAPAEHGPATTRAVADVA